MNKRFYVAYGSNLNLEQMKYRCPTAKLYGTGKIENYELQFKGRPGGAFATIAPKKGSFVPAAVWEIQPRDERVLDQYEGYPSHYFKQNVSVQLDDKTVDAMVYLMNLKMDFGLPSPHYYRIVYEGYNDCDLDTDILHKAVENSAQRYYSSLVQSSPPQNMFDDYNQEDYEDEEFENRKGNEMDDTDPFNYSM